MVSYHPSYIVHYLPEIAAALPLTLLVLGLSVFLGLLLGLVLTWGQLSEDSWLRGLARGIIFLIRCTPPVVMLFLVFYGLPEFVNWWLGIDINDWSRASFTVLSMMLLFAAPVSELVKAAYLAIPRGQTEAGLALGLTEWQTVRRIVLPQALRVALPNLTTAVLNLLKDTALAYTIGLVDIMGATNLLISRQLGNYSLEAYTAVALIYWGLALVLSLLTHGLEKGLERKGA